MSANDQMRIANKLKGEKVGVILNAISSKEHDITAYHPKIFALGATVDLKG